MLEKKPEDSHLTEPRENLTERVALRPVQAEPPRAGSRCPACGQGVLDYDGLLVLRCPLCDFSEGGCFT